MTNKANRSLIRKLNASWQKAFAQFFSFGGFSSGNRLEVFHSGDQAFLAIIDAIESARESITLETYTLASDRVGVWVRDALVAARKRGVVVTVLYDHIGSAGISGAFFSPMREAGIKVVAFNPIWPWRRRGPLLFRDHRKIIVVDESVAFCGGMNISVSYAGPTYGTDRFRDSLARVKGPAVKDLLNITRESIAESEFDQRPEAFVNTIVGQVDRKQVLKQFLKRLFTALPKVSLPHQNDDTLIQVLRSNMRRNMAHIQRSMEESVDRAVNYCYFTTPYFLPHDGLRRSILNAKRRGVDVRILTAGISDVPLMRYASHHVYTGFLQLGIRIYEMTGKTLHAKLSTIDGVYASIGSYNLDHWSARRNLEVNLSIIDQQVAKDLKEQFMTDIKSAQEITQEQFLSRSALKRFLCWLSYLVFRI